MRHLGRQGDRLAEYRAYLGMTLEEIEAFYGIKGSTWNYAETEGKAISSKILDALRKISPPSGKQRPDFDWLSDGVGEMIALPVTLAEPTSTYVTGMLPDRLAHVRQASKMVMQALTARGLEGRVSDADENRVIDLLADGLSTGRTSAELEERLDLVLRLIQAEAQSKESQ